MTATRAGTLAVALVAFAPGLHAQSNWQNYAALGATDADGKLFMINDNDFDIAGDPTQVVIVEGSEIGPR